MFCGDGEIVIDLHMEPTLMQSAVGVFTNQGKAALQYGPLIYCVEGLDHEDDVHTLCFDTRSANWQKEFSGLYGCPIFHGHGFRRMNPTGSLYYPLSENYAETELTLIPYHAFANREETDMLVFLGYR